MKLIGFGPLAISENSRADLEWKCEDEDDAGFISGFEASSAIGLTFFVSKLELVKPHTTLKVIATEFTEDSGYGYHPVLTKGSAVALESVCKHLSRGIPEWEVEVGDRIIVGAWNVTACSQIFSCSMVISNEHVSLDGRWWVEDHDGETLIRPVLWAERGMKTGTVMGHMRIAEVGFAPQPPRVKTG